MATAAAEFECANCGETADLLRCSRCHAAFFCSRACLRAYWPFHRLACHRNEFADAVEDAEPKFASWMRGHGKLAVLKDDEVDRLERAGAATTGASRAEVLQSMYNRLEPKPQEPSYTAEEMKAMRLSHQQSLTQVVVQLTSSQLLIKLGDKVILSGQLYSDIKREESMWLLEDGILHLTMLKRNRRGNYADHCTNADTFWKSVMTRAPQQERLALPYPPNKYYALAIEDDISSSQHGRLKAGLQQAQHMQLECSVS